MGIPAVPHARAEGGFSLVFIPEPTDQEPQALL